MDDTAILVIGIGNEYRSDDRVGLAIVRALKKKKLPGTKLIESGDDSLNLIDTWKDAKFVILVDAVSSDSEPGTIFRYNALTEPIPTQLSFHSSHAISVAETIELGNMLHQLPPNLFLFGIEGKHFSSGIKMSAEVENAIPDVIEEVIQVIQTFQPFM
ncbi:MAG TPA: hydrogenase maturation protease [Ktedonobacteraceae bacterium]|nr:hydrogenase maturation protease [Ktedonobacteraceae bacterium]HXZ06073.1 hydrogenase maturation protease [Ktedonobacteraceae bacterium]